MEKKILLGFEVGTGKPVEMDLAHLIITGLTQQSGKTTTIEAIGTRGGLTIVTFRTKRDELGFEKAAPLPIYFDAKGLTHWKVLEGLIASILEEKVQREPGVRAAIMHITDKAKSLREVMTANSRAYKAATGKHKGFMADVHFKIQHYLEEVVPEIEQLQFTDSLQIKPGFNMMDLTGLSKEMQSLVLMSTIRWIHQKCRQTIVVVPEAHKFIPQDEGSPVKTAVEDFTSEGAILGNFMWFDTQNLRSVDKKSLRHCDNWILGRQRLMLEVVSTLDAIPLEPNAKPKPVEIQRLEIGQFIACLHNSVAKVYVQPAWLGAEEARKVAITGVSIPRPANDTRLNLEGPKVAIPTVENVENLRKRFSDFEKEVNDRFDKMGKAVGGYLSKRPSPEPGQTVELTDNETTYRLYHKEAALSMTTSNREGQVLYVMLNDLEGEPASSPQISAAMAEHGWSADAEQVRLIMLKLVKDRGLAVKEGSNYRLGKYAKVTVTEQP